ncbi:MAG: 3-phosphoshikimate 1-carboxyvinyltransferase [Solobacterium sp.]|nr:3-phosphoshikimate 1-carboxyvinyltransferase [Solobacterium sp.]
MKVTIHPKDIKDTIIQVPSSKSYGHRLFIAAALHDGISKIHHVFENEDIKATRTCLENLGATFQKENDTYLVTGIKDFTNLKDTTFQCGESGSTLRFLIPLVSESNEKVTFTGKERLFARPLQIYEEIFKSQNIPFQKGQTALTIEGALQPGEFHVPGNISSQFISGLLFVLPLLKEDSKLVIEPPYESKSYVDMTIEVLNKSGIQIHKEDHTYHIPGNQVYQAFDMRVEGDASQAAFFAAFAAMHQKEMKLEHLNPSSIQGDAIIFSYLKEMGAEIKWEKDTCIVQGNTLNGIEMDLGNCPDLGPILFALATQAKGKTIFKNVARLRLKESDRIEAMKEELECLGCKMEVYENEVIVYGDTMIQGNIEVNGHNDHRIVMALSILASKSEAPITISGAEAITKSYPTFFADLKKTGVEVYD